jgi:hypothetical protein
MTNTRFTCTAPAAFARLVKSKSFFAFAALLACCLSAHVAEAAPRSITACKTISLPGSYILTRDLTAVGNCLVIEADNVTIDLDGYSITGDGFGDGIWDKNVARENVTVRNGVITNFVRGIWLVQTSHVTIEHVRASKNAHGIVVGKGAIIRDNVASGNVQRGIDASLEGNLITGNVANDNGDDGITAGTGSTVSNNTAQGNADLGIIATCASNVVGNTATNNGGVNITFFGPGCRSNFNVPNVLAP